jgi:hypothetical protein
VAVALVALLVIQERLLHQVLDMALVAEQLLQQLDKQVLLEYLVVEVAEPLVLLELKQAVQVVQV